ncbi:MAG: hypothetical protein ABIH00_00060 [Armatimonadota bacterium]
MKKYIPLLILVFIILALTQTQALTIVVTGDWNETINDQDLSAGTGSELTDTYESITNAAIIDISGCIDNSDTWRIDVKRVDGTWSGSFTLYVKRTSEGTGGGSISEGTSYMQVNDTYLEFFSGAGDRSTINVQYKLTGPSLSIPANTYITTAYFTIIDT